MKKDIHLLGRQYELDFLAKAYQSPQSQLTVVYGRRRIGKSTLIRHYCRNKTAFVYNALKIGRVQQIRNFLKDFSQFIGDPLIGSAPCTHWRDVFDLVVPRLSRKKKIVLVLDEFQWMCLSDISLLSVLQHAWDNEWQVNKKIHLILCGSSTSFMLSEVLAEKSPLFGRRTQSLEVKALPAVDGKKLLKINDIKVVSQFLMCFGGVPAYLLLYNKDKSFEQNINALALVKNAYFTSELQYVLVEQFKQPATYYKILRYLAIKPYSLAELARTTKISTGSLMYNMERLIQIGILGEHRPILLPGTSKTVSYSIVDEYVRFYFIFVEPYKKFIEQNRASYVFDRITHARWHPYLGLAFELFCHKNLEAILKHLDIVDLYVNSGRYWHHQSTRNGPGVQIDLVIERRDGVTHLVECKWSDQKIGYEVVRELEEKCTRYPNTKKHKLRKLLITTVGASPAVKEHPEIDVMTLKDFF